MRTVLDRIPEKQLLSTPLHLKSGRVCSASGPVIRAKGSFCIGEICSITRKSRPDLRAEVVGFDGPNAILTPYGAIEGISFQSKIKHLMAEFEVPVGYDLIGRVLDATGEPIDSGPQIRPDRKYPSNAPPPDPMSRPVIADVFSFGVRALDGPLTCGIGQRMGVFAAAGGGKSTLLSMLAKYSNCDRIVIGLIGERGREVREFLEHSLGEQGMKKSILIVATSDRPAIEQVKAAYTATAIAEFFRDQGENVLLLMDSLTRFARAQRQIGLAAGEPPTRRGYPPSLFEKLPGLVERAGMNDKGSITALYTVLVEGDDMNEPVADETRSLIDGHIILSRKLAEKGHYPAIDVTASASRVFQAIVGKDHYNSVIRMKGLLSKYNEIELLLQMGEYQSGSDQEADAAIARMGDIRAFLQQRTDEATPFDEMLSRLVAVV